MNHNITDLGIPNESELRGIGISPASVNMLVAKDNAVNREVMQQYLHKLGYVAEINENGVQCLEKWKNGAYDVLLTDCKMPETDGYELTSQMRAIEAEIGQNRTVVIGITTNVTREMYDSCLSAGMDDCLPKPFNLSNLSTLLNLWVPRTAECSKRDGQP
jgi:CheY-like chemotaxis protein